MNKLEKVLDLNNNISIQYVSKFCDRLRSNLLHRMRNIKFFDAIPDEMVELLL